MTAVFLILAAASALTTWWVRARHPNHRTGRHARPYGARRTPHQPPRHHHARSTP